MKQKIVLCFIEPWPLFTFSKSLVYETSMQSVAPRFVAQLTDCSIVKGDNLTLSAPAIGNPAPTYIWYFNGDPMYVINEAEYPIVAASSGHAGNYKVVASNSVGSAETSCRVDISQGWAYPGMVRIPKGTNSGTDPDFESYSLSVDTFYMDATEVTNDKMVRVMQWAYDIGRRWRGVNPAIT